jgi:hypothetical protein
MPPKPKATNPSPENVEEKTTSTGSAHKTNNTSKTPKKARSRVPRGQWNNSFSSSLGGALAPVIVGERNSNMSETINKLFQSLQRRFDKGDVVAALYIDLLLTDYWRLSEATKFEKKLFDHPSYLFDPQSAFPTLTRYIGSTRRNLDSALKMLRELEKDAAEAAAFDAEFVQAEPESSNSASPQTSPAAEKSEEPAEQGEPAPSVNETASPAQPAADAAAQSGEKQPTANDNAPETPTSAAAPHAETGAPPTAPAPSKPAEAVDAAAGTTEGDVPKAA